MLTSQRASVAPLLFGEYGADHVNPHTCQPCQPQQVSFRFFDLSIKTEITNNQTTFLLPRPRPIPQKIEHVAICVWQCYRAIFIES